MLKYVKAVFKLKTIMKCNMLIFYMERLPFLGKYLSYFMLRHTEIKKGIGILTSVFWIAALTVIKSICILIFGFEANLYLAGRLGLNIAHFDSYYFQSVFFLFCVLGAFQESRTFLVTKTKYICLTQLKMPVKEGILSFLMNEYFIQFLSIGFVFYIFGFVLLQNHLYFYVLTAAYISMQLLSECVHLFYFKKTSQALEKRKTFSLLLFAFSFAGAYGPLVLSRRVLIERFLTSRAAILIYVMIGIGSVYYIFFRYEEYSDKLAGYFKKEDLVEELARKRQEEIDHSEEEIELFGTQKMKKLQGYPLLNGLFVLRNRKQFLKYLKRRLIFLAAVFVSVIVGFVNSPLITQRIFDNIYRFVPILPVLIASYAYGEGFCRFYYTHCDSKLLAYSFYRTRKAILENYFIKLKYILKYNVILGTATAILFFALFCMAKIEIWNLSFLLLEATTVVLNVVFGIQHLSVYYLLQPYIKDSTIQNPILVMVQMPVLMLTYVFTMLSLPAVTTMLIFVIGSMLYAVLLIAAVFVRSPAAFRLK